MNPCSACLNGNGILCSQKILRGKQAPFYGGYSECFVRSKYQCVKVPEEINFKEAALVEPAACALQALRKASLSAGSKVLIIGCGTIGVILVRLIRLKFGESVIVHTHSAQKNQLAFSEESGSDLASVDLSKFYEVAGCFVNESLTLTGGYDVIFDFSVTSKSLKASADLSKPGGKIVWLNFANGELPVSLGDFVFKGISIFGSHGYGSEGVGVNDYLTIFDLLCSKKLVLSDLISKIIPLEEIHENLIRSCLSFFKRNSTHTSDRVTHRLLAVQSSE